MIAINEYVERLERAKKQADVAEFSPPKEEKEVDNLLEKDLPTAATTPEAQQQPTAVSTNAGNATLGGDHVTAKKKKRTKKKKNKKKNQGTNDNSVPKEEADEDSKVASGMKKPKAPAVVKPAFYGLKDSVVLDYYVAKTGQTHPPTIPVAKLFPDEKFPNGEVVEYNASAPRVGAAELRSLEHAELFNLTKHLRQAAEVHKQVRAYAQGLLRPGVVLADFCEALENKNRQLVDECGLARGIAFPTGVSLNHVAAHYSPNTGDGTVLQYDDVLKIDFGTQIQGAIVDSAFTIAFNAKYNPLLEAVRSATDAGLAAAGVDARICDIAVEIQETMESYEVELDGSGKVYPVKAVRGLCGHDIHRYRIHGGKQIPSVAGAVPESMIMEEGEVFAIETFGSTGRGYVVEDGECSHYMKTFDARHVPLRMQSSKKLLNHINKTFGTLAFCRRWLDRPDGGSATIHGATGGKQERYMGALKNLCDVGLVQACPPLADVLGSYTAQYEHTVIIGSTRKEIVTRGLDY